MILPRGQSQSMVVDGVDGPVICPDPSGIPGFPGPLPDPDPASTLRDAEYKAGVRTQLLRSADEHKIEVCWVGSRTAHGRSLQSELQARLLCPSLEVIDAHEARRPIMRLIPGRGADAATRDTWNHFLISISFTDAYLTASLFNMLRAGHIPFSCVTLSQAPYKPTDLDPKDGLYINAPAGGH
ncbi:hypothetical protein JDV02_009586 [Purpureocillium takamizusanense]|uniref:Uncharacterized protein n=1 Tax=Purpureocillium takamizusanense TaxID=2060973 RepID=A0A9Q8QP55_9HYPO|nr:uncharacterized protein JDV02_009586 [Purpureocillium takamizusanense]UNI23788.1 hypothetical protein JDV02_009586 [Purpureocillium takamizusanense]